MKAFPKITNDHQPIFFEGKFAGYEGEQNGMDLRDYFAAKAMQGFLSNSHLAKEEPMNRNLMAENSYKLADAMIKARGNNESK